MPLIPASLPWATSGVYSARLPSWYRSTGGSLVGCFSMETPQCCWVIPAVFSHACPGDTTLLLSHSSGVQSCLSWFTKSSTQPTKPPADDNVSEVAKPLRYGGWSHVVLVLMARFNRKRNAGLPGGGIPRVGNGRINPPDSICRRSKSVSLFNKTILNNPFSSPKQVFKVWGKLKNPGSINQ